MNKFPFLRRQDTPWIDFASRPGRLESMNCPQSKGIVFHNLGSIVLMIFHARPQSRAREHFNHSRLIPVSIY